MSYDTKNTHLVAIDNSQKGRVAIVFPPRTSLTKEQALMFAAWLVTTADAAEGIALDHLAFAQAVSEWRDTYTTDPTGGDVVARLDAMQGVTIKTASFQTASTAREVAAAIVAVALDGSDLVPFFERIAAVHGVVGDGSELDRVLKEEGEPINLKAPVKRIDAPASAPTLGAAREAVGELGAHEEAQTDAGRRRTVPKS